MKKNVESQLTMDSFLIDMVANASAQLFIEDTLNNSKNSLPEHLNLEAQWAPAISETTKPSLYKTLPTKKLWFLKKELSKMVKILLSRTQFLPFHHGFFRKP